jgi:hypothetical protein
VATEGKETEPLYFDELKARFREVVTVLVSAGRSGQSNPQRVLDRLRREIANRASWTHRDQAWLPGCRKNYREEMATRSPMPMKNQ